MPLSPDPLKQKALQQQLGFSPPPPPGPPGSPANASYEAKIKQATAAPAAPSVPAAPSQPTQKLPTTGAQLSALNPASDLRSISSYNPSSGQPDPRDSTYWANMAKLLATSQQAHAGQQLEQTQSDVGYQSQLSTAGEQRRRSVRDMAENLIGTGLLRSGSHNRKQTEATIDYTDKLSGWGREKGDADARRKAQMDAILSNLGIDELGLYSEATDRYSQAQAERAAQEQAMQQAAFEASLAAADDGGGGGGGGRRKKKKHR